MDIQQKAVAKKKKTRFFETYISKVLKQVSETNGITSNAKQQLNSILCIISKIISTSVTSLTEIAKKKTLSEKEVINALRIVLPQTLASNAIIEGEKAVEKFKNTDNKGGSSRQEKSGIIFPPSIAEKFLRNFGYSKIMVSSNAPVCLAAAVEYLSADILESAIRSAKDHKRIRITIRDIELAIRNDTELNELFVRYKISLLGGGNVPFIHSSLLSKKSRKKRVKHATPSTKKPHRFRPGTVALREIRKYQKLSNCLTFAKYPFEKFVREVVNKHSTNNSMKISKDVFIVLQYFIEQYIVNVLHDANLTAIHAGRVKLMPVDINFILAIRDGTQNPYNDTIDETEVLSIGDEADVKEEEKEEKEEKED